MLRLRRRDRLIAELARQLAESHEQLGAALERVDWYKAAMGDSPLYAVPDQAPRAARRTLR